MVHNIGILENVNLVLLPVIFVQTLHGALVSRQ